MGEGDVILYSIIRFPVIHVPPLARNTGGETGIRTLGTLAHNGFRDRPVRPLRHLSTPYNPFKNSYYQEGDNKPYFRLMKKNNAGNSGGSSTGKQLED